MLVMLCKKNFRPGRVYHSPKQTTTDNAIVIPKQKGNGDLLHPFQTSIYFVIPISTSPLFIGVIPLIRRRYIMFDSKENFW